MSRDKEQEGNVAEEWRQKVRNWGGNNNRRRVPLPRKKEKEGYLGPMPLPWLEKASEVVGGGGAWVLIAIWYRASCSRNGRVQLTKHLRDRFHLGPKTVFRGLTELEAAGLVFVERSRGHAPVVTLLPFSHPDAFEEDNQ